MNRTLLKTCTYGLMHLTVAIIVAFALTRDWRIALAVGIVEPIVQTFAFAIHERFWAKAGEIKAVALCGHGHSSWWARRARPADREASPTTARWPAQVR